MEAQRASGMPLPSPQDSGCGAFGGRIGCHGRHRDDIESIHSNARPAVRCGSAVMAVTGGVNCSPRHPRSTGEGEATLSHVPHRCRAYALVIVHCAIKKMVAGVSGACAKVSRYLTVCQDCVERALPAKRIPFSTNSGISNMGRTFFAKLDAGQFFFP
jgi:hypothetical protein